MIRILTLQKRCLIYVYKLDNHLTCKESLIGQYVSSRKANSFHLMLKSPEEEVSYMTKIFICQSQITLPKKHCVSYWKRINSTWRNAREISPNEEGIVIGILDVPTFIGRSAATLSGILTYSTEGISEQDYHCTFPSVELTVQDFVKRHHTPFTSTTTDADFLSIFITSFKITLKIEFLAKLQHPLQKMLINHLKFTEQSAFSCLYHNGDSFVELAGIMLHIEAITPQEHNLIVYARDRHQLYVFVHCMYTELPTSAMIVQLAETSFLDNELEDNARSLLIKEFDLVIKTLSELPNRQSAAGKFLKISKEKYSLLQDQLSELEMKTDVAFKWQ